MTCECRIFKHKGWCSHVNPEGHKPFSYIEQRVPQCPSPSRDHAFEQRFMDYVEQLAAHLGVPGGDAAFTKFVFHRAGDVGSDRYGDTSFLTDKRELPMEAMEEAGDLGVYTTFEAEKRGYKPGDEEYHHLAQAAAYAAKAFYHLRVVERLRRG